MVMIMWMFMIIMIIFLMFIMLNFSLMKLKFKNKEKMSPYECGFDPISSNRLPFSLQFFLISMIFLIFDIEISLFIPMMKCFKLIYFLILTNLMIFIILILLIGLLLEWKEGALKWFK